MTQREINQAIADNSVALELISKVFEQNHESLEIQELVTRYSLAPLQSLEKRYECVKCSQAEGNFDYFKKLANLIADVCKYACSDSDDEYECCLFDGSNSYDFEFFLELARFYQLNPELFAGHFDVMKKHFSKTEYYYRRWNDCKKWLKNTLFD